MYVYGWITEMIWHWKEGLAIILVWNSHYLWSGIMPFENGVGVSLMYIVNSRVTPIENEKEKTKGIFYILRKEGWYDHIKCSIKTAVPEKEWKTQTVGQKKNKSGKQ